MRVRLGALVENVRSSLFLVPMLGVVAGIVLGLVTISLDSGFDQSSDLPLGLSSTVESARAVLTTIAGATITVAGIAFSVSLLVIQLGSSQYSPRVVHTLFRDPFNKRVMGLVLGTFTYCLVVLRSVRSAIDQGDSPVIPSVSVSIAVLLGIAAVLAIVAFINHSAHSMDISEILEQVSNESIEQFRSDWSDDASGLIAEHADTVPPELPSSSAQEIRFDRTGWVQQVNTAALVRCAPPGGTVWLDTTPGRYAIIGVAFCTISPPPPEDEVEEIERAVRSAVGIGETRTMQQDAAYGLRQLVDVALKALSPGINDPTTAQDAIFHATAVLGEALRRRPPPSICTGQDGRQLVLLQQPTHAELVKLTFDEIRRAAASQPTVCIYALEALDLLHASLRSTGFQDRISPLADEARLVVEGCEAADLLPSDLEVVRSAYRKRFDSADPG